MMRRTGWVLAGLAATLGACSQGAPDKPNTIAKAPAAPAAPAPTPPPAPPTSAPLETAAAPVPAAPDAAPPPPPPPPTGEFAAGPRPPPPFNVERALRSDPDLRTRLARLRTLLANAEDRDATGQVGPEHAYAMRAVYACSTRACVQTVLRRREAALRSWEQ